HNALARRLWKSECLQPICCSNYKRVVGSKLVRGAQFAFRTSLLRNSPFDRCWSEGDSKPQVFGFLLEPLDLLVLITLLIIFHPFVYVLLAVFEHAIDQPRQVVGHSSDRLRGSEFCVQPFELGPQIGFTAPQAGRGHAQGRGRPVLDRPPPTVIYLAS